ncbi:MAG: GNAT family N-acetyltransferase [Lachnospiraceae bacterium]|nr:GNAT family N-acetyltransferase [Lachnospiraceae bacterium]
MQLAFEMEYLHPTYERTKISMVPYSSEYKEEFKRIYNECYHEMRQALGIEPFDFIEDDSFFESGMDKVYLLIKDRTLVGSVALKGNEIDDLIVNTKYQNKGYGKQILLWAIEHIDSDRIVLHVAKWNKKAVRLYQKSGFRIINATPIGESNMIREARREDLKEILELYLFLHEESVPKMDEHLKETWDQIMEDENHHLIVNEIDGKIVSSCVCVIIPNLTRNVRPYAFVENVVTHADHRKKGYAGECLEYAKGIAEQANCYKMMLLTGSKRAETLNFYENAGYNSSDKTAFIQWIGTKV